MTALDRPYVLLSCAASLDGCVDDGTGERLILSNDVDLDRVDAVRAGCDAILVGANTIRRDDPRLLVRSADRARARTDRGLPPSPVKVTITSGGDLDPAARFFTTGDVDKIVYTTTGALAEATERLSWVADVVAAGDPLDPTALLADLATRGVARLLVEGGTGTNTLFLTAGLVDELHLVIAPFLVGDPGAPRLVGAGRFAHDRGNRARLAGTEQLGDCVLLRYALSDRCALG